MRMYDVIAKKRDKKVLTKEEIDFFIESVSKEEIPDYQISALLMAIYLNGMNTEETSYLTMAMAHSGEVIDLSKIKGIKVDKHSTGGVGDKTSLIVGPIVASFGVPVAKMSGRGLGHTGGTIDKLESIEGFEVSMTVEKFIEKVNDVGMALVSQTGEIAIADKKLYALRDVTATVSSMPLIASSVMSKKIAGGADAIVLDVKCGSGAFMKNLEDAKSLARLMVSIGENAGKKTVALITNMEEPLGCAIGNALEIEEVIEVLNNEGPPDLRDISIELASNMLYLAGYGDISEMRGQVIERIKNGKAFEKFEEFIESQGGNLEIIENPKMLRNAKFEVSVKVKTEGYVKSIDTEKIGIAQILLGGGRIKKDDKIDYSVGIRIHKKIGDFLKKGEEIATIYTNKKDIGDAWHLVLDSYELSKEFVEKPKLIYDRITKEEKA